MEYAVTAQRIKETQAKTGPCWQVSQQVPAFTIEASSLREARVKALEILGKERPIVLDVHER